MNTATLTKNAIAAMENAIRKVVDDHKKRNRKLAVWKNGKVALVSPSTACMVREKPASYGKR